MSPLADSGWARLRTARGATGLIGKWAAGRRETMARCGTGFAILAAPLSSRSDAEVAGIEHGLRFGLKAHSPIDREPLGSTTRPATTGIGRIRHFPPRWPQGRPSGRVSKISWSAGISPDDVVIAVVADRMDCSDAANGFVLDGFPRTVAQAESLDRGLAARGIGLDAVLELEVDEDVLLVRIKGRAEEAGNKGQPVRRDDNPASRSMSPVDSCGTAKRLAIFSSPVCLFPRLAAPTEIRLTIPPARSNQSRHTSTMMHMAKCR